MAPNLTSGGERVRSWLRDLPTRGSGFRSIWVATALLFAASPIAAAGSLSKASLLGMLPFAAILATAAVGQTLVVQQGGLDLSVPGMISLSAAIITTYPHGDDGKMFVGLLLVVAAAIGVGLLNGVLISYFKITPLIATLGVGAILTGGVYKVTGGIPNDATHGLERLSSEKSLIGIPNTVVFALAVIAVVSFLVNRTSGGRRFRATGANPRAARVLGISVARTRIITYVGAALCYSAAGVILAGFLRTPTVALGDSYLLATIAAVVLGGTPLTGGAGSVVATGAGALFLTQLDQVVLSMGAPTSAQMLIEGGIIALSMVLRLIRMPQLPSMLARVRLWLPAAPRGGI